MLVGLAGAQNPTPTARATFLESIRSLSIDPGLKLVLDAGDAASYTSGQKWLDVSGNGYDFFRGTTSASETPGDATFNGSAGGRSSSEFFSSGASADWFDYDTTNESWMNNLHKDNAKFTAAGWIYKASSNLAGSIIFTNVDASGTFLVPAIDIEFWPAPYMGNLSLIHYNGGAVIGTPTNFDRSGLTITQNVWTFFAVSFDESTGTLRYQLNGATATSSMTYTSPSAANATGKMEIGMNANTRLADLAVWEGTALTAAQMNALFQATRDKFGV